MGKIYSFATCFGRGKLPRIVKNGSRIIFIVNLGIIDILGDMHLYVDNLCFVFIMISQISRVQTSGFLDFLLSSLPDFHADSRVQQISLSTPQSNTTQHTTAQHSVAHTEFPSSQGQHSKPVRHRTQLIQPFCFQVDLV